MAGATGVSDDVLVAYPSVDRAALAALSSDDALAAAVTLMVDDVDQLDLVDASRHLPLAGRCGSASSSTHRGRCPGAEGGSASGAPPSRPRRHWRRSRRSSSGGPASSWSG